ncbi:hypothetical protein RRSWK_02059 [Rhodopirellula sp. SWK7]|nr:hypothetical protein RRSWK_02059 [Rhodopirellula sp. SWK7]
MDLVALPPAGVVRWGGFLVPDCAEDVLASKVIGATASAAIMPTRILCECERSKDSTAFIVFLSRLKG